MELLIAFLLGCAAGMGLLLALPSAEAQERRHVPHVALVVDRSGSMQTCYATTLAEAVNLSAFGADDGRLKVWAFSTDTVAWPEGWARLPDGDLPRRVGAWLGSFRPDGRTQAAPALRAAMLDRPDDPTYVLLMTDGQLDEGVAAIGSLVAATQAERRTPCRVSVFLAAAQDNEPLRQLAEQNGGSYLRMQLHAKPR